MWHRSLPRQMDTIWNTELLGLLARNIAIIEMIITEPLATTIFTPAERFKLNTPSSKFLKHLKMQQEAVNLKLTLLRQVYLQG